MHSGMIHACMPICRPFPYNMHFVYVLVYFNSSKLSKKENNWLKYKQSNTKSQYDSFYRFSADRKKNPVVVRAQNTIDKYYYGWLHVY